MLYQNLWIWDIVNKTSRHWLRSCCLALFGTPSLLGIAQRWSNHQWKYRCVFQLMRTKKARPKVRRRSEIRRDVDVCPPTVPGRNLDIFRHRTSIWGLIFCVRTPQTVRRRLAKFRLKSQVSKFYASESISVIWIDDWLSFTIFQCFCYDGISVIVIHHHRTLGISWPKLANPGSQLGFGLSVGI